MAPTRSGAYLHDQDLMMLQAPRPEPRTLDNTHPSLRFRRVSLAALLGALILALALVIATESQADDPPQWSPDRDAALQAAIERARIAAAQREAHRASPEQRERRRRSRTTFRGQSDAEALLTARQQFADLMREPLWRGPAVAEGQRVARYESDHLAVIADERRESNTLLHSVIPLRARDDDGAKRALSVELIERGGTFFEPANALTEVRIGRRLGDGVRMPRSGVGARAAGVERDVEPVELGDRLFWPNVARDTDFMVAPLPFGFETFHFLRSAESPERLSLDLTLPDGAEIVRPSEDYDVLSIVRGKEDLAAISAPRAFDAGGEEMPVRFDVRGSSVALVIDHRGRDVQYPVQVDPTLLENQLWWEHNGAIDFNGWEYVETFGDWNSGYDFFGSRGLWVATTGVRFYPAWSYGMWRFKAPGDTFVSRAQHGALDVGGNGRHGCMGTGFFTPNGTWDNGTHHNPMTGETHGSPAFWCLSQSGFTGHHHDHRIDWDTKTRGNYSAMAFTVPYDVIPGAGDVFFMGGAATYITDDRGPVNLGQTGLPEGWSNASATTVRISAEDHGFGMRYLELASYPGGNYTRHGDQYLDCLVNRNSGWRCPRDQSAYVNVQFSEGITGFQLYAEDALANGTEAEYHEGAGWTDRWWEVRIDRTAPRALSLSGALKDLDGKEAYEDAYTLRAVAYDDDPQRQHDTSGIRSLELLVDGRRAGYAEQACDVNCGMAHDFTFRPYDYDPGTHKVQVVARDGVGLERRSQELTIKTGAGVVNSPKPGLRTPRRLTLQGAAKKSGPTSMTWQFRRGDNDAWSDVPVAALRTDQNEPLTSPSLPLTNGQSAPVSWDLLATDALQATDGAVQVRALLGGGTPGWTTNTVKVDLDQKGLESKSARQTIGLGDVNLLTGNFALRADDVSVTAYSAAMTVSRTYNSRDAAGNATGPFGPGWTSSVPVSQAASEFSRLTVTSDSLYVYATLSDGTELSFARSDAGYTPEPGSEDLTLRQGQPSADAPQDGFFYIRDLQGTTTVFQRASPNAAEYLPSRVEQAGSPHETVYVPETTPAGVTRIKQVIAPAPPGWDCRGSTVEKGCRRLNFAYADATTATGDAPAGWGDYKGRLTSVTFTAFDPGAGAVTTDEVARYAYDSTGRLRAAWDPRIAPALKTVYDYDAQGLLVRVTPPGQEPWELTYRSLPRDPGPGRLRAVSRSALASGTATWTLAYQVPLSGSDAPYPMGVGDVGRWGQRDIPVDATAVFPPDQVPGDVPATYSRASVHYLNRDGYSVNVASPGGNIATAEHDLHGNVVRELSPRNRQRALSTADPATEAQRLDTQRTYAANGLRMIDQLEPLRDIQLESRENVKARRHTVVRYDEGAPGGEFHLPTTTTVGARVEGRAADADVRTTATTYNWKFRVPTAVTQDAGTGRLNLVTKTVLDDHSGLPIETRMPRSPDGGDASATQTLYYTSGAHPTDPECGNRPEWYNLQCRTRRAAQPATPGQPGLPVTTYSYTRLGQVARQTETVDATSRTTEWSYDAAGRQTSQRVLSPEGTAVPAVTTTYSSDAGLATRLSTTEDGVTREVRTEYDRLGRLRNYTDASGNVSTTTYDLLSRPVSTNNGKGSQVRTYDPATGLIAKLDDSAAGSFTADYDAEGAITRLGLPNGLRATTEYDSTGVPVRRVYEKQTDCAQDCKWLEFTATPSVHGQIVDQTSTMSRQRFAYDGAGRLVNVEDTPTGGGCTVRSYRYDANSNRIGQTTRQPRTDGLCDYQSSGAVVSHRYDAADRLIDEGYAYDAFGRTTKVPGADANGGALETAYFVNGLVRSQTQDGVTNRYTLDPGGRPQTRTTTASGDLTESHHYADPGDSPAWSETAAGWTRNIEGIDSDLVAVQDSREGTTLQLTNLHGDVVATAATDSTARRPVQTLVTRRGADGAWSSEPVRSLEPGTYTAVAEQSDLAGNLGGTAQRDFTVTASAEPQPDYRSEVLADQPVSYWRLGERSGTTGADETGANAASYAYGPVLGRPGALPGQANAAVRFDGIDDRVSVADATKLNAGSGNFTAEAWVKTNQNGERGIVGKGTYGTAGFWTITVTDDTGHVGAARAIVATGAGERTLYSTVRIDDDAWHHIALVVDRAAGVAIFVDGREAGRASALSGDVSNGSRFEIGRRWDGTSLDGEVDEVAFYARALTEQRLRRHYLIGHANDAAAPTVTLTTPADGTSTTDAAPGFSGTAGAHPTDAPDAWVDITAAGSEGHVQRLPAPGVSSGAWQAKTVRPLAPGTYRAVAQQPDAAGNVGESARTTFKIDSAAQAASYRSEILADAAAGYWRLGESSGSTAADQTGNNSAAYTYGPTLGHPGALPGQSDTAVSLDGIDDRVAVTDTSKLNFGTGSFTAEAWVKTTRHEERGMLGKGTSGFTGWWETTVTDDTGHEGKVRASIGTPAGSRVLYSPVRVDDGKWHHVALVVDRANGISLTVDGDKTSTATALTGDVSNSARFQIGQRWGGGNFAGQIDEVAVYPSALSPARILRHYRVAHAGDTTAPKVSLTTPSVGSSAADATPTFTGQAGNDASDSDLIVVRVYRDWSDGPIETFESDEFGVPRDTRSSRRFAWLGGKQRTTELRSGVVQMGVRSYLPSTGRFLSVDPIRGGSANDYDYANADPVNTFDLDGRAAGGCHFEVGGVPGGHDNTYIRPRGSRRIKWSAIASCGKPPTNPTILSLKLTVVIRGPRGSAYDFPVVTRWPNRTNRENDRPRVAMSEPLGFRCNYPGRRYTMEATLNIRGHRYGINGGPVRETITWRGSAICPR